MGLNKEADNTVSNSTLELTFQTIDILLNAALYVMYSPECIYIYFPAHMRYELLYLEASPDTDLS